MNHALVYKLSVNILHICYLKTFPPGGSLLIFQTVMLLVTLKDTGLIRSVIDLTTISVTRVH